MELPTVKSTVRAQAADLANESERKGREEIDQQPATQVMNCDLPAVANLTSMTRDTYDT